MNLDDWIQLIAWIIGGVAFVVIIHAAWHMMHDYWDMYYPYFRKDNNERGRKD